MKNIEKYPNQVGIFEIRFLGENQRTASQIFAPGAIDDAVDWTVRINETKLNIYAPINPVDSNTSTQDVDILRAHFSFADANDAAGVDGIGTFTGPRPDMVVTTGVQAHRRLHAYWRLHEPCFDLAKWRTCQKQLAERLDRDTSITNPTRIMRVAGTVSYPNEHKQQKGYMQELVTLKVDPEAWP
mgnify:FL=1|tara:strand:+ start:746 stop:1300 length:555 start_codon:yes stop_codon:yes gene_type:complete